MTSFPKLACLIPTFKRPECLANAVQCLLDQDYSGPFKIFILDDASQHFGINDEKIKLITSSRYESLPLKYNALLEMAREWGADAVIPTEDDDFFLKWHLSNIADAMMKGCRFFRLPQTWSNYGVPKGEARLEDATGRFHSSWAFSRDLIDVLGGWEDIRDERGEPRLIFDQHISSKAAKLDPVPPAGPYHPGYVYRWNNGIYHGSQAGDQGFKSLWNRLGEIPAPWVGTLLPRYDAEGEMLRHIIPGSPRWPLV